MADPILQTTNLDQTFRALRNRDPQKIANRSIAPHQDYPLVPSRNFAPTGAVETGSWGSGEARFGPWRSGMQRFASDSGIIYGQPQFFSPVHTPINWQIPSKRLEEMQWMYLPGTEVLMDNFTYREFAHVDFTISQVDDDDITGGIILTAKDYPKIMDSEGCFRCPPRLSARDCKDKRCFEFKAIGSYRTLNITEEHCIFVLDGEKHRHYRKVKANKNYRKKRGIKPNGVQKVAIEDNLIKRIQAHEVKDSDYLLTVIPKLGKEELDRDLAWLIGLCVADGCLYKHEQSSSHHVRFTGRNGEISLSKCCEILKDKFTGRISSKPHGDGKGWRISAHTKKAYNFFTKYIQQSGINKHLSKSVSKFNKETVLNIIGGYLDGDGCFVKVKSDIVACCYSKDLADQISNLLLACNIVCSITRRPLSDEHYPTSSTCFYQIKIPSSEVLKIAPYMRSQKVPKGFEAKKQRNLRFFYEEDNVTYLAQPIDHIKEYLYTGRGYDIEMTNERHALVADGYVCSNSRFFYQNEAKVAAAIDFYSFFPMSDWTHECRNREAKLHFDKLKKRLNLPHWTRLISHEVHLLGDCFPLVEIDCDQCGGSGRIGSEICEHEGGTVRRIVILNPDYIEIYTTPMNPEPIIALRPNEELIDMVQRKTPGYERLSKEVIALISSGQPIHLDNRSVGHIKYGECGYTKFGVGMVRRLFPTLSYKTKLMVAQWIVAERLIVPIKIVKVGSDERPAGPADLADVQAQLSQTANDPNLTIVTHHAFELDFFGAAGKVLTLSNEFDLINQEILDGMMINNALLNGEGPNFTHSADTRIMTNNGLKYCDEFDIENDLVATFNPITKELEYQQATQKFVYEWDSIDGNDPPLKHFKTNRIDMLVTPNHRMLCSERKLTTNPGPGGQKSNGQSEGYGEWKCVRAHSVKNRSRFRACFDNWTPTIDDEGQYYGLTTRDFLTVLGWYISEGYRNKWMCQDGSESISKVSFSQSKSANEKTYNKMVKLTRDNKIFYMTKSDNNVFYIRKVDNCGLVEYLAENCGHYANSKCIPQSIKNMSKKNLRILLDALVEGDGSERCATKKKKTNKKYFSYTTVSRQLRDDVIEILFKLGYSPRFNTIEFDSDNLQTQYTISWGETNIGKFPVLSSRRWDDDRGSCKTKNEAVISDVDYSGKVWCVEVPNHFIVTERNGLFGIHGNSSASVGIEAMIQRLKTFRQKISQWLEEFIYRPEAKRQGFIDEDPETGEEEYVVPTIKWEQMHLRDQQQDKTFAMQLYEKGLLSAQTLLELFGYDPDMEIERKRYDTIQMTALGQGDAMGGGMTGGMGGGMGGGLMGGDLGGAPPIAPPGGEMGGGIGGMPGGAPAAPTGGVPLVAQSTNTFEPEIVDPSEFGGRVLTKKTRDKLRSQQTKMFAEQERAERAAQGPTKGPDGQMRDEKGRIIFTKPERELIDQIRRYQSDGIIKYPVQPQYRVKVGNQEYPLDFAVVNLRLGIEADGEKFHGDLKQIHQDKERDSKLAQMGWTILRFTDREIEKKMQQVMQTIVQKIQEKEQFVQQQLAELPK